MMLEVSARLRERCHSTAVGRSWLARLPDILRDLSSRWSLSLGSPFTDQDTSCAWVAPVRRADGSQAVLKVALPHFEGEHEIAGLRFWSGDPTVRLLDADEDVGGLLLERCEPGTSLQSMPEREQDVVVSSLLRRLWRTPPSTHPFRHLSTMVQLWTEEALAESSGRRDPGLTRAALSILEELSRPGPTDVLLATDLHAGNVLRAQREPWLVIDPKPFIGDSTYDATQHLLNRFGRPASDPTVTIRSFADLLQVDAERVRLWTFARAALTTDGLSGDMIALARTLAP